MRSLCSQSQFPPVTPCACSRAQTRSRAERGRRPDLKCRHLHGSPLFSILGQSFQRIQFRSSSTPLPWASSMTKFQNARQNFQNHLQSEAQGLLSIFRPKIKQSTTSWLWSKPSRRRKRLQGSCHLLPREATRPPLELHTRRFTSDRNPKPHEWSIRSLSNCGMRTPMGSMVNRLYSTSKDRFTGTKNNAHIGSHPYTAGIV